MDLQADDDTETRMREGILPHFHHEGFRVCGLPALGQGREILLLFQPIFDWQHRMGREALVRSALAALVRATADRDALPTLQPAALEDRPTALGAAAFQETVDLVIPFLLRLIRALRHISLQLAIL